MLIKYFVIFMCLYVNMKYIYTFLKSERKLADVMIRFSVILKREILTVCFVSLNVRRFSSFYFMQRETVCIYKLNCRISEVHRNINTCI